MQARKVFVDEVEVFAGFAGARAGARACAGAAAAVAFAASTQRIGRREQVLLHRQVLEHAAPLHHVEEPRAHEFVRTASNGVGAVETHGAARHLAVLEREQVRHRLERRRLARAVGAEQRDDRPARHGERQPVQRLHCTVVDDLDVLDFEDGAVVHVQFSTIQSDAGSIFCCLMSAR